MTDFINWCSEFFSDLFSGVLGFLTGLLQQLFGAVGSVVSVWLAEQGFSLSIPSEVFNVLDEITLGIGYIFPLYALMPIVAFMLTFYIAKIVFAVFSQASKFLTFGG